MRKTIPIFIILFTFLCYAQNFQELPADFGKIAYKHVEKLCEFGTRSPGSKAEVNTIEYLKEQFSEIHMKVEIDTFYYNWINLKNRQIILNGTNIPVKTFYVNESFQDTINLKAECYVINSPFTTPLDIKDKIVFSNKSNHVILIKSYSPKAVVVFNNDIFAELIHYHKNTIEILIPTEKIHEQNTGYNVVASYTNSSKNRKDIIITAHWDSQNGPGADDNASGTSVLVELARYFLPYSDTIAYNLKFIATGAEEEGLIGSKSYVLKHSENLKNCLLNINIDGVGNGKKPYIEMRNPIKFKEDDTSSVLELISTDNFQSNLSTSFLEIYRNSSSPEIYPKWLTKNIKSAMKELKYRYSKASCCSGADHRSFAYIDIPVMYLTIISRQKNKLRHTPQDLPTDSFINNLDKAGNIIRRIIINICNDKEMRNY